MENLKKYYVTNLKRKIKHINQNDILFICIGTKEIIWDSIGPIIGSKLKQKIGKDKVIGSLEKNICSKKDIEKYENILKNKFLIAIDSALGDNKYFGNVFISNGPIYMGKGINEYKGKVGDISIKPVVKKIVKQKDILNLSNFVIDGIIQAFYNHI